MLEHNKKQDLTSSPSPPPLSPPPNKPSRLLTKILKRTIGGLFVLLAVLVLLALGTDVLDNLFGLPESIDTTREGPFMESKDIVFFEPAGEIDIPGDIITHKQLVSLAPEGTSPLNVASKTTVQNLSAEFWNDLSLDELTLELILENGQIVQKKVVFGGGIETTKIDTSSANIFGPLVVHGPTALQNVTANNIASNDIDARNLSVSEDTILNNLSVNQNLAVGRISSLATTNISGPLTVSGISSLAATNISGPLTVTASADFQDIEAESLTIGPLTVTASADFQDIEAESLTTDSLTINTAQIREILNIGADNEAGILVKTDDGEKAGQPQIIYNPTKGVWMLRNSNGFFSEITTESTDNSGSVLMESEVEAFIFDTDNVAGATKIAANADGIDMLTLQRFTDVSPTGNFINLQNTAGNSLLTIDALGRFSTDILPAATSTRDLGSSALRWANVFVDTMNAGTIATDFTQGSVMFAGVNGNLAEDNANFFFNDTTNFLGIGTASPGDILHLAATQPDLRIETNGDTTSFGRLEFYEDITRKGAITAPGSTFATADRQNDIEIKSDSGDVTLQTTGGNVGIGTSSPAARLDIRGDATQALVKIANSGDNAHTWFNYINGSNYITGDESGGVGDTYFRSWDATNGYTNHMTIKASGNVGIGAEIPQGKLDVAGDIYFNDNKLIANYANSSNIDHIWHDDAANQWHFVSDAGAKATGNSTIGVGKIEFISGEVIDDGTDLLFTSNSGFMDFRPSDGTHGFINRDFSGGSTVWSGWRTNSAGDAEFTADSNYNQFVLKANGRVGVGTALPTNDFHVVGTAYVSGNLGVGVGSPGAKLDVGGGINTTGTLDFTTAANTEIWATRSGTTDTLRLKANDDIQLVTEGGSVYGTHGTYHSASDERLKENIEPLTDVLSKLIQIDGVSYEWINSKIEDKEGTKLGLIAQDVEEFFPEVIHINNDEMGTKAIEYNQLSGVFVSAIKEITKVVDITNATGLESPSIYINNTGNVGIGGFDEFSTSTTPQYKLHVAGKVGARAFVITDSEFEKDAPSEVLQLDSSGQVLGVNMYKLATSAFEGFKTQQKEIEDIKTRLAELEIKIDISHAASAAEPYTSNFSSKLIASLKDLFRVAEIHLRDGIVAFKELSIDKLITRELTLEKAGSGLYSPDPTVGTSTLKKDERKKTVQNISVKENSMIFVSVRGETPVAWSIGEINPGVSFTVHFERPAHEELLFQWWIVQVK